ncbi:hypothetical protein C8J56DRAFT_292852 [Mycena floridula]|nr:hypothetical protein C8J56DRAFT_292852 [Mycena floridula]
MPPKAASKPRTWGTRFDYLPSSSSPPPSTVVLNDVPSSLDASSKKQTERAPHDACIFAGSLPAHPDTVEVASNLRDHLAEYAEVKHIKVVRDSKGGNCAFIQCQDAVAAIDLLAALSASEPKPFMGRILRYEQARAFRTLLISYRIPTQFVPSNGDTSAPFDPKNVKEITLDMPSAMRLCKPRNARNIAISYNENATNAASRDQDESNEHVLHIEPVVFDAETLKRVVSHFGPIDEFLPCRLPDGTPEDHTVKVADVPKAMLLPHDNNRHPSMDGGVFQVKWAHRDDCVNALTSLRGVPHLTVTWAHLSSHGYDRQYNHNQRFLQQRPQSSLDPHYVREAEHNSSLTSRVPADAQRFEGPSVDSATSGSWILPQPPTMGESPCTSQNSEFTLVDEKTGRRSRDANGQWNDFDFPPLGDPKNERRTDFCGVWGEKKAKSEDYKEAEFESDVSAVQAVPLPTETIPPKVVNISTSPEAEYHDEGQELSMPPTPGFGMSPLTPKTSSSMFPPTPTTGDVDLHFSTSDNEKLSFMEDLRGERELDPTTLFVGGLEMYGDAAWDEEKISGLFQKFGGLENVRLVRPTSGNSAFAFIKFNNTESPLRAVAEEHNRVHDGRTMRVQLRDCNARGGWKQRGRGRYLGGHHQRNYHDRSDFQQRDVVSHVETPAASALPSEEQVRPVPAPEVDVPEQVHSSSPRFEAPQPEIHVSSGSTQNAASLPSPSPEASPATEPYREWYELEPGANSSPPPSSTFSPADSYHSATNGPAVGYPGPPTGYYGPPPPWMPHFPQPMQYPMPFYPGYPGFQGPASDANGSSTGAPPMWPPMGMYGAYIPYPAYAPRPPNVDQGVAQQQPPVAPTGFIQNDQGTLIAVYQPEALDQYMSGNGQSNPSPTPQPPIPTWANFPPSYNTSTQTSQLPPRINVPPRQFQPQPPRGWFPSSQSAIGLTSSPSVVTQIMPSSASMQLPNSPYFHAQLDTGIPNLRRQNGRRDQNPSFQNSNRGQGNVRQPGRRRGAVHSPGFVNNGEGHQHTVRVNPNPATPNDWTHWTVR